jgi:hypothetical protein
LADKLVELDSSLQGRYKSLLFLSLPFLSDSRIEVCVDIKHFERLVDNSDDPSSWIRLEADRDIIRELNIAVPSEYKARGFSRAPGEPEKGPREEKWILWKSS